MRELYGNDINKFDLRKAIVGGLVIHSIPADISPVTLTFPASRRATSVASSGLCKCHGLTVISDTKATRIAMPISTAPTSSTLATMSAVGAMLFIPSNPADTLEQIDVALNLMDKYSDTFTFVRTAAEAEAAMRAGKVASFMGIEGAHQLGNSLGGESAHLKCKQLTSPVLRQYYNLGVRYATLTHSCNNAFADSGGFEHAPNATWHGLS